MTRKFSAISKDWHIVGRAPSQVIDHVPAHYVGADYLTVKEAATRLRCEPAVVYRLISSRQLWAQPRGRNWLIPEPSIADYLERERKRMGIA